MDNKLCPVCNKSKPINQFGLDGKKLDKDGNPYRRRICNSCKHLVSKGGQLRKKDEKPDFSKIPENLTQLLAAALVELSRFDIDRLKAITEDEFLGKTNSREYFSSCGCSFKSIQDAALAEVMALGYYHPSELKLGPGRYMIVGDSHGKHTKRKMFKLISSMNKKLGIKNIIHVGHILDDDNVISCCWSDFKNLIVMSKIEEAKSIENHIKEEFEFAVVRNRVRLGKLSVVNQDLISDYVRTFVGSLNPRLFEGSVVVNSHRHEMDTRCRHEETNFIASPGCMCEKHIVRTIKQIDFTAGYQVKQAYPEGFIKYRRMQHNFKYWENGLIIVEVDSNGDFSIVPCRIKKLEDEFATSVYDKIYISDKVRNPDKKIFINTDIHCDKHDSRVLDIQSKIVKEYKPDIYINLGDIHNNSSLNHHDMDKGYAITKSVLSENATVNYVLKRLSSWAPEKYLFYGNHERFMRDFYFKFPQFTDFFNEMFSGMVKDAGFEMKEYKDVLTMGDVRFVHGNMKMFRQKGDWLEKFSNTFGENIVIGHLHSSAIRLGAYLIGASCDLDQGYNEPTASYWCHGFGQCNQYHGETWISNFSIVSNKILYNGGCYKSLRKQEWVAPESTMRIVYDYKK